MASSPKKQPQGQSSNPEEERNKILEDGRIARTESADTLIDQLPVGGPTFGKKRLIDLKNQRTELVASIEKLRKYNRPLTQEEQQDFLAQKERYDYALLEYKLLIDNALPFFDPPEYTMGTRGPDGIEAFFKHLSKTKVQLSHARRPLLRKEKVDKNILDAYANYSHVVSLYRILRVEPSQLPSNALNAEGSSKERSGFSVARARLQYLRGNKLIKLGMQDGIPSYESLQPVADEYQILIRQYEEMKLVSVDPKKMIERRRSFHSEIGLKDVDQFERILNEISSTIPQLPRTERARYTEQQLRMIKAQSEKYNIMVNQSLDAYHMALFCHQSLKEGETLPEEQYASLREDMVGLLWERHSYEQMVNKDEQFKSSKFALYLGIIVQESMEEIAELAGDIPPEQVTRDLLASEKANPGIIKRSMKMFPNPITAVIFCIYIHHSPNKIQAVMNWVGFMMISGAVSHSVHALLPNAHPLLRLPIALALALLVCIVGYKDLNKITSMIDQQFIDSYYKRGVNSTIGTFGLPLDLSKQFFESDGSHTSTPDEWFKQFSQEQSRFWKSNSVAGSGYVLGVDEWNKRMKEYEGKKAGTAAVDARFAIINEDWGKRENLALRGRMANLQVARQRIIGHWKNRREENTFSFSEDASITVDGIKEVPDWAKGVREGYGKSSGKLPLPEDRIIKMFKFLEQSAIDGGTNLPETYKGRNDLFLEYCFSGSERGDISSKDYDQEKRDVFYMKKLMERDEYKLPSKEELQKNVSLTENQQFALLWKQYVNQANTVAKLVSLYKHMQVNGQPLYNQDIWFSTGDLAKKRSKEALGSHLDYLVERLRYMPSTPNRHPTKANSPGVRSNTQGDWGEDNDLEG